MLSSSVPSFDCQESFRETQHVICNSHGEGCRRYTRRYTASIWARISTFPEPVKHFETHSYDAFCVTSSLGSLIHATVESFGGTGRRPRNLVGLAA